MNKELTELLQNDMDKYLQTVGRMPILTGDKLNEVMEKAKAGGAEQTKQENRLCRHIFASWYR